MKFSSDWKFIESASGYTWEVRHEDRGAQRWFWARCLELDLCTDPIEALFRDQKPRVLLELVADLERARGLYDKLDESGFVAHTIREGFAQLVAAIEQLRREEAEESDAVEHDGTDDMDMRAYQKRNMARKRDWPANDCRFIHWDVDIEIVRDDGRPATDEEIERGEYEVLEIPMGPFCHCGERNNPYGGGASACEWPCDFYTPREETE